MEIQVEHALILLTSFDIITNFKISKSLSTSNYGPVELENFTNSPPLRNKQTEEIKLLLKNG